MAFYPLAKAFPVASFGYPRGVRGQLLANGPRGGFFHDAVGWRHGALQVFRNPSNKASAHIIINLDGPPWQFVDFDDAAWHAGGRIPAGHENVGALANLFFWGFEYEGGYPEPTPITDYQIDVTLDLCGWLGQHYGFRWPAQRRVDLWEHREVRATSCPSDRIRWPEIIRGLAGQPAAEHPWARDKLRLITDHQARDAAFYRWMDAFPETQRQKDDHLRQTAEARRFAQFDAADTAFDRAHLDWRRVL